MDETFLSYFGVETGPIEDKWSYISDLINATNIVETSSSTLENQISWGTLNVLEGEVHHYEKI